MCQDMSPVEKAIQFHGHMCPGLLIGVRMAEAALNYLGVDPDRDEELLAIMENDSCSADAIQAILSCTFGKGNLVFNDYGKQVVTVASRQQNRAVRIAARHQDNPSSERQRFGELNRKGDLTQDEEDEREELRLAIFEQIMTASLEDMFIIRETAIDWPAKATIYPTVVCGVCGEGVSGHRAQKTAQGYICWPCSQEGR